MSRRAQLDQWAAEFIASLDPRDAEAAVYQLVDYANAVEMSWVGFDDNHRYLARRRRDGAGWMVIRPDHTEVPASQVLEELRVRRLPPITTGAEPSIEVTAPRNKLTLADIEAEIAVEHYFNGHAAAAVGMQVGSANEVTIRSLTRLTICVLILHNGHKAVGVNHGPVDPANFDAELGRKYAREDAIAKLWEPLGFRLRDRLSAWANRPLKFTGQVGTMAGVTLTEADAAADLAGTPRPDFGLVAGDLQTAAPSCDHAESAREQLPESTASEIRSAALDFDHTQKAASSIDHADEARRNEAAGCMVVNVSALLTGAEPKNCTCGPRDGCATCAPNRITPPPTPDNIRSLCETLRSWRLALSYNESYAGETEGALKRLAAEIDRNPNGPNATGSGDGAEPLRAHVITPTVGRKVWFYSGNCQTPPAGFTTYPGDQACDATVVFVYNDRMVNLLVIDHIGRTYAIPSVRLVQPGDAEVDARSHRAEWMPYQVKQANGA